jgi:hypothetical protein
MFCYTQAAVTGSIELLPNGVYPTPSSWSEADMATPIREEVVVKGHLAWLSRSLGIPPWGQVLILALIAVGWWFHSSLGAIDQRMAAHDTKLQLLPLEISKDLLSQAQVDTKLGRIERAERITEIASSIIAKASVDKLPASADYFKGTVEALNSIYSGTPPDSPAGYSNSGLFMAVQQARLMLADYRSSLEPAPVATKETKNFENSYQASSGEQFISPQRMTLVFTGKEMIGSPIERSLSNNIKVSNAVLATPNGAYQILDGIHWKNVTFVGARIKYQGGDIDLENVRFVNCTFDVIPAGSRSQQFIDYAALANEKLRIG